MKAKNTGEWAAKLAKTLEASENETVKNQARASLAWGGGSP